MAIYYRPGPDNTNPQFSADQLYKYLGRSRIDGHIYLELDGKPSSVWEANFELIGERDEQDPQREIGFAAPMGEEFTWRGQQLSAVAAGSIWVIDRGGNGLVGPPVVPGEHWPAAAERIKEWLDLNVER